MPPPCPSPASGRGERTEYGASLRFKYKRTCSILSLGFQAEHELPIHASGRIPIEADVRGGRVRVAPGALQRLLQKQALPARCEEEGIDGADQETDAKRLVAAIAQAHVHADGISARGGLECLGKIAKHEQARRVDRGARLGDAQLHGGELGHTAVAALRVVRTLAIARKSARAPSAMPSTGDTMAIGSTARKDCRYSGLELVRMPG